MALIKCKECGSYVSLKAENCPQCGVRISRKSMGCLKFIGIVFLGLIILAIIGNIGLNDTTNTSPSNTSTIEPKLPGSQWHYYHENDPMSKGEVFLAMIMSSNTVDFDFPYNGVQHGSFALRTHPRRGKDIMFKIENGQILCPSYENCSVLVRFDDEKGMNFSAIGAGDHDSTTIFIKNYKRFVKKMLKAKRVRIAVKIYQEGATMFEFDVRGFEQNKYKPTTKKT